MQLKNVAEPEESALFAMKLSEIAELIASVVWAAELIID